MRVRMKIILVTLVMLLGVGNGNIDVYAKEDVDSSYIISRYNVDIVVNENNTLDITEDITAYFNTSKHGIFRTIPLKNEVERLDGTTSSNRAQVTNLWVNDRYTKKIENNNLKIQIGDANKLLTGSHDYKLKYTYNIGKDPLKDKDELYFNVIGSEWDTEIRNITFRITMPKDFDVSKLGFSAGLKGTVDSSKIKYTINGKEIIGSYEGVLRAREALTVRCELSEGYFVGAGLKVSSLFWGMVLVPIIVLGFIFFLWSKHVRGQQIVPTVEFYPPSGFNSLEVGFLYKGEAKNKDVTSLLIYLANKGYIQISDREFDYKTKSLGLQSKGDKKIAELSKLLEEERVRDANSAKIKYYENLISVYKDLDKPIDYEAMGLKAQNLKDFIRGNNKFVIKKIREYDGINEYERMFMEGLFPDDITETNEKILANNFYFTKNMILGKINNPKNKKKIVVKSIFTNVNFLTIITLAIYWGVTLPLLLESGDFEMLPFALVFPIIGFGSFYPMFFSAMDLVRESFIGFVIALLVTICFGGGFILVSFVMCLWSYFWLEPYYFIALGVGIIAIGGITLMFRSWPNRTEYGVKMLGKIKGFKNFLEVAEKDKLEALVRENPTYFYDILPFTYVLGVSDEWIKKFEVIVLQAPSWYDSSITFSVTTFSSFMISTMVIANRAMTTGLTGGSTGSSSGGSSSGGSSSGGGSSGGGSGGGGGGSW